MSSNRAESESSLELSLVLQLVGYGLFGLFVAFLLKLLLPVALLQPAWQLQAASALRTTAIFPLLGAVLLLQAQWLCGGSRTLAAQLLWMRRFAFFVAIGFVLLIPLQTQAGVTLLGAGNSNELRSLRQVKAVAEEIRAANTEAAMKLAISHLPGAPAEIQGSFTKPIDQVRAVVLEQLQPQIQRADERLAQLRKLRLQGGLLGWISDGLAALALAACFGAVGRLGPERSSLLVSVLVLPGRIREQFAGAAPGRSKAPVDAAWFESIQDPPSAEEPDDLR